MNTAKEEPNYWAHLGDYLARKWHAPRNHPTFFFYLFIAVIGAGGLGIWSAIFRGELKAFVESLYTYFPAVAMASAFELILPHANKKYERSLAISIAAVLSVLAFVMVSISAGIFCIILGILGYFLSLALWWIANAENKTLHDTPIAEAAIGGDVNKQPKGDTSGFTT